MQAHCSLGSDLPLHSEELADTQEKRNAAKANFDWWPESRGTNEPLETAYNE